MDGLINYLYTRQIQDKKKQSLIDNPTPENIVKQRILNDPDLDGATKQECLAELSAARKEGVTGEA